MRLGGRLAAAIEVLGDIDKRHRPVSDALKDWGLSHRFAGAGDRAAIGNIVYDALRRKRSAAWRLGEETPRSLGLGALLLEWGETEASLDAALDGDRFAPPPLSAAERGALASRHLDDAPDEVRADCPDWCVPMLQRSFGEAWVAEGRALSARPPLDLRVNTLLADRAKVMLELGESAPSPSALAPHGLRIAPVSGGARHPNVQAEPAFQKGWFEVQDEGSQIVAALAEAEPGAQVLDLCAGAGGKTLALSADMDNRGQVFAYDQDKSRLAPIFDRLRRAGSRNVQALSKPAELAPLSDKMDIVVVDAPCTGSGTWRRRPDAKWRLSPRQLQVRQAEQAAILDAARSFVKPGGRLVYITCSVFAEENADQVRAFLGRDPGFAPLDHAGLWARWFPGHADKVRLEADFGLSLTPARTGTDGFYFCALRRQG